MPGHSAAFNNIAASHMSRTLHEQPVLSSALDGYGSPALFIRKRQKGNPVFDGFF